MQFRLTVDGEAHEVEFERSSRGLVVRVDGAVYRTRVVQGQGEFLIRVGARRHRIAFRGAALLVDGEPHEVLTELSDESGISTSASVAGAKGAIFEVHPPMPGRVVRVPAAPGAVVKRGQTLAVLEAMKMQNEILSPTDAVVREVGVSEGESITTDRVIAVLETK
jgi:biotin carboxyl carrier protein